MSDRIDIFDRWKMLGVGIQHLNGIIQNDVPLTKDDVKNWERSVLAMEGKFMDLVKETLVEVDKMVVK